MANLVHVVVHEFDTISDAQGWQIVPFDNTVIPGRVAVGKLEKSGYQLAGKYPIIDQSQQYVAGFSDDETLVYCGDLPVVVFGDHTRVLKYVDFPFICGADGTKVLVPNKDLVDPHYLYYVLSALDIPNRGYNRHYKLLREQSLPLPPLPEQRRIAHVLSPIQRAIQAQDAVIAAARELKRSLMQRLFTYGPYAEPLPTKETEIGEVPEGWELDTIGSLCETGGGMVQTGPFGSQLHASDYVPYGIPTVMPKDIVNGRIATDRISYIGEQDHHRLARYHLKTGDIVYARRGDIGRCALVERSHDGWLCGTGSFFIRIGDCGVSPRFLYYFLGQPEVIERILAQAIGTTMLNLNSTIIKSVPVAFPARDEQDQISRTLDAVEEKERSERNRRGALEALFKSMLHQLMTGQVRVLDS